MRTTRHCRSRDAKTVVLRLSAIILVATDIVPAVFSYIECGVASYPKGRQLLSLALYSLIVQTQPSSLVLTIFDCWNFAPTRVGG